MRAVAWVDTEGTLFYERPISSLVNENLRLRREAPTRDREKLSGWLREAANELEKAHAILDEIGAPEEFEDGVPLSLAARIAAHLPEEQRETKTPESE